MANELNGLANKFNGLRQMQQIAERKKIVTSERVINGNQMVETCKNSKGEVLKVSVFIDKNGDGNFDAGEAISVKYNAVGSLCGAATEYRDVDGDGYCDEIVDSSDRGPDYVRKPETDNIHGKEAHRMDLKYGYKWDSNSPIVIYGQD